MNPLNLALFLGLVATAMGAPQYGGSTRPAPQRDRCTFKTELVYREVRDQVCNTYHKNECKTLYRNKCTPYQDEVCDTYQERHCDTKYRTKYRTATKQECRREKKCERIWIDDGYGGKTWREDPSNCLTENVCNPVEYQEEYEEPYDDCYNVPQKKCRYETKQRCKDVPYQDCKKKPYKECKDVHKEVPARVRRKICNGKLVDEEYLDDYDDYDDRDNHRENHRDSQSSSGSYSAQDVADAFDLRDAGEVLRTKEADDVHADDDSVTFE